MAEHNDLGRDGELVAREYLASKGFIIVDVNWRRPYGEIDIVARETSGVYHFVEVKTVSWETAQGVSHETKNPAENIHPQKVRRLIHTILSYIELNAVDGEWQFDIALVFLDQREKRAKVRYLENVILNS